MLAFPAPRIERGTQSDENCVDGQPLSSTGSQHILPFAGEFLLRLPFLPREPRQTKHGGEAWACGFDDGRVDHEAPPFGAPPVALEYAANAARYSGNSLQ